MKIHILDYVEDIFQTFLQALKENTLLQTATNEGWCTRANEPNVHWERIKGRCSQKKFWKKEAGYRKCSSYKSMSAKYM